MRRLPKRKGISLGTILMLSLTCLVLLGCVWLYPRLVGETSFHFDAKELAVVFDRSHLDILKGQAAPKAAVSAPLETTADSPQIPFPVIPSATAVPDIPQKRSFRLTAAGSVQLDAAVQKTMADGDQFSEIFAPIAAEIKGDLSLFTLEQTAISTEKNTNNNLAANALPALQSAGFNAVSLGYPGIFNNGLSGTAATQDALRAAGITPYGVFATKEQRNVFSTITINGVTVTLLSYQNDISNAGKKNTTKDEQAFAFSPPTLSSIGDDIQRARAAGGQVIIVSLSWGKKGATAATNAQRELAQSIANAGADIILGTFSGAVQPVEVLTASRPGGQQSQTLCAYSLGNLFSNDRSKRSSISGILLHANITYDPVSGTTAFDQLSYTPTYVWKGRKDSKNIFSIFPSDITPPDYVKSDQVTVMNRSLSLIQGVMQNTAIPLRTADSAFSGQP